jgi:thiol-disulfide isomerase/thioredoxin
LSEHKSYSDKLQNDTKSLYKNSSIPIQCTNSTADEGEGSQGNGNCGTSEDEGDAADPYIRNCNTKESDGFKVEKYKRSSTLENVLSLGMQMGIPKQSIPAKVGAKLEMKTAAFDFNLLEFLMSAQGYTMLRKKMDGVVLKCPEEHNVHIKYKEEVKKLECKKCRKRLVKCIQFAELNNGKVKNESFSPVITYECERGHQWECRYGKSAFSHWCPHCERLIQERRKRVLEQEAENLRQEAIKEQNAKLEEARRRMQEDQKKATNYQALFYQWELPIQSKGLTDASVNQLSKELAEKYLKENSCSLMISFEDIFLVYKILITTKEMLIAKLRVVPAQELCSFYRKCAAKLHPDKNRHPRAIEPFKKLTECYKLCCS